MFVLLSGRLVAHRTSISGRDLVLSVFRPGTLFGEMAALEDQPRSLRVYAETHCRLLYMPTGAFRDSLLAQPIIALNLATELCHRLRNKNEQMFGLVMQDVEARLRLLLLQLARESGQVRTHALLRPAPTQEALAARIGANREAVSRALSRLKRLGLIGTSRRNIVIRNIDALAAHAEI
ncbi:Crp/Fnr family transcriptional regulator [Paracoccus sp. M683]|uniref:Crp/Fnr family transcriptional regulator n=1 Tax=Paracoccus sp. M683 TaxID=2594268 RepID=UPI00117BEE55|nr:Crp/Fnr family transcriptional regulator [Paracoccus sp. M683]TRW96284.1 Crp/Fnr family transcriptional regulator [Paracoccus sp. M683]